MRTYTLIAKTDCFTSGRILGTDLKEYLEELYGPEFKIINEMTYKKMKAKTQQEDPKS